MSEEAREVLESKSYHVEMREFMQQSRRDKRLTPITQLVYRVLVDLANSHYWTYPLEVSDEELREITHIGSRETVTEAKRRLKNLGYIEYEGKPSRYVIFKASESLVWREAREKACGRRPSSPEPPPPRKDKEDKQEKGVEGNGERASEREGKRRRRCTHRRSAARAPLAKGAASEPERKRK